MSNLHFFSLYSNMSPAKDNISWIHNREPSYFKIFCM